MQSACSADNRGQMDLSPDSPSTPSGPSPRGAHAAIAVLLLATALGAAGCGAPASGRAEGNASLLFGGRGGPIAASQLARAAAVAKRFAAAYSRAVYLPHPPPLPAATPTLQRRIEAAAVRVPPARLGLRPRALSVAIEPQ